MTSSTNAVKTSPSVSHSRGGSSSFHVSGSAGTRTRNRINAALAKQHFVLHPDAIASSNEGASTSTVAPLFDAVPRNAEFESLRPILARLPSELVDDDDDSDTEEDSEDLESLDYILRRGVMYTRSRLPSLDSASIQLWKALHHFRPLSADYALGYLEHLTPPHPLPSSSHAASAASSCPVFSSTSSRGLTQLQRSFNWSTLPPLPKTISRVWYGVLFLSIRAPSSESLSFYEADRLAHEEATRSGGLIMYWYGSPHLSTGANLATCIWTSRKAAIEASKLPLHKQAAAYAAPSYERYDLVRYKVVKRLNETRVRIEAWTSDDDRRENDDSS